MFDTNTVEGDSVISQCVEYLVTKTVIDYANPDFSKNTISGAS